jgi:hypothetical protein
MFMVGLMLLDFRRGRASPGYFRLTISLKRGASEPVPEAGDKVLQGYRLDRVLGKEWGP